MFVRLSRGHALLELFGLRAERESQRVLGGDAVSADLCLTRVTFRLTHSIRINNPERARTVFHALVFGAKNSGKVVCEFSEQAFH